MLVTLFAGARTNQPHAVEDWTWDAFADEVEALCDEHERPAKTDLLALGPYRLRDGATRSNEAVEAVTVLALDVDHIDSIARLKKRLKAAGHAALVYGSPSDDPKGDRRVRVLAPLTRELAPDECGPARAAFAESLGLEPGCGVGKCLDPARLFFVGRVAGTEPRFALRLEGDPVDPDALPPAKHSWAATRDDARAVELHAPQADPQALAMAQALFPVVASKGARHATARAVGGYLGRLGWPDDRIAAVVALLPSDNPRARLKDALDAADRAFRGEPTPGAGDLVELAGEDRFRAFEAATLPDECALIERRAARRSVAASLYSPAEAGEWRFESFLEPRPPIDYTLPALALAPSLGKVSLLAGQPGVAKGPLLDHLAVSLALGLPVFGEHEVRAQKVLLLDFEGAFLTMLRSERLARGAGADPRALEGRLLVHDATTVPDATDLAWLEALERVCDEQAVDVVAVDSYSSAMLGSGVDTNSPDFAILAKRLGTLGRLVLCVAHAGKASSQRSARLDDIAGSYTLGAFAQTAVVMHYPDPETDRYTVQLGCGRAPERAFNPFCVRFVDTPEDGLRVERVAGAEPADGAQAPHAPERAPNTRQQGAEHSARRAGERIVRALRESPTYVSRRELVAVGGEGPTAANHALALLSDAGLVQRLNGEYGLSTTGKARGVGAFSAALGATATGFQRPA